MLKYTITPKNLGAHLLRVVITIDSDSQTLTAKLPKWIPGSYKIRDYSRFIQCFAASDAEGAALNWRKRDSDTWEIDTHGRLTTLTYEVYAYDLSVRGAYLDDTRLFFNHCCSPHYRVSTISFTKPQTTTSKSIARSKLPSIICIANSPALVYATR